MYSSTCIVSDVGLTSFQNNSVSFWIVLYYTCDGLLRLQTFIFTVASFVVGLGAYSAMSFLKNLKNIPVGEPVEKLELTRSISDNPESNVNIKASNIVANSRCSVLWCCGEELSLE